MARAEGRETLTLAESSWSCRLRAFPSRRAGVRASKDAAEAAHDIGFPLAAKINSSRITHKDRRRGSACG